MILVTLCSHSHFSYQAGINMSIRQKYEFFRIFQVVISNTLVLGGGGEGYELRVQRVQWFRGQKLTGCCPNQYFSLIYFG